MKRLISIVVFFYVLFLFLSSAFGGEGSGGEYAQVPTETENADVKPDDFEDTSNDVVAAITMDFRKTPNITWNRGMFEQIMDSISYTKTVIDNQQWQDSISAVWSGLDTRALRNWVREMIALANASQLDIKKDYGKAGLEVNPWFIKAGVEGKLDLLVNHLPTELMPPEFIKKLSQAERDALSENSKAVESLKTLVKENLSSL